MRRFPQARPLGVILPARTAQRLREAAAERWGARAIDPEHGPDSWVLVWRQTHMGEPFGGVRVRWSDPSPATAQVHEVGWDADRDGSAEGVLGALNTLLGWPLLR